MRRRCRRHHAPRRLHAAACLIAGQERPAVLAMVDFIHFAFRDLLGGGTRALPAQQMIFSLIMLPQRRATPSIYGRAEKKLGATPSMPAAAASPPLASRRVASIADTTGHFDSADARWPALPSLPSHTARPRCGR